MIVTIRLDLDDDYLEALGHSFNKRRATRADVKDHVNALVDADASDLMDDLENEGRYRE